MRHFARLAIWPVLVLASTIVASANFVGLEFETIPHPSAPRRISQHCLGVGENASEDDEPNLKDGSVSRRSLDPMPWASGKKRSRTG